MPRVLVSQTSLPARIEARRAPGRSEPVNVMILVSNPGFQAKTITGPVETLQVAPTILEALGLDPDALDAARAEGTQVLPGLPFRGNENME